MTALTSFLREHPRLSAWAVLAVLMNLILVVTARDVGLLATQWLALIVATTGVAGVCVWLKVVALQTLASTALVSLGPPAAVRNSSW